MPRFLDTTTGGFCWIADPSTVTYAILSHTWRPEDEGGEQTYDDIRKLVDQMKESWVPVSASPDMPHLADYDLETTSLEAQASDVDDECILPHPDISDKIRGICKIAREAGYKLVWIDSACIDKSSSAELAEAINSMFDLYRLADVCYVYLADVPDGEEDPERDRSQFRRSRWHSRGWTLQELLAPKDVVFLTASWTFLGTKSSLVWALSLTTKIDGDILVGRASLNSVSVARRMSWASSRKTTRIEDEAYCLLGIFGVHLSPIYGEGRNAFLRLQEEIMKTIPDQSIFAWGATCLLTSIDAAHNESDTPVHDAPTGFLASSPKEFSWAENVRPLSHHDFRMLLVSGSRWSRGVDVDPNREVPPLQSVVTPEGVRIKAYTIDTSALPQMVAAIVSILPGDDRLTAEDRDHCLALGRARSLAVLRCTDQYDHMFTLAIFHSSSASARSTDLEKGVSIATHIKCKSSCPGSPLYRVVCLEGRARDIALKHLSPTPVELSLLHHSKSPVLGLDSRADVGDVSVDLWPSHHRGHHGDRAPLSLAPSCRERLHVCGLSIGPLRCRRSESGLEIVAETSIFRSSIPASVHRPTAHIRITLTLSYIECKEEPVRWAARWDPPMNTSVRFSITRFVHIPPSDEDPDLGGAALCEVCHHRGCEIKECASEDDAETSRTVTTADVVRLPERRVAQAYFLLPLSMESELRDVRRFRRVLQLALECPLQYASDKRIASIPGLWLAVDVSGALQGPVRL